MLLPVAASSFASVQGFVLRSNLTCEHVRFLPFQEYLGSPEAHFVDIDLNNRQGLLGLKRMEGDHSGEEIAKTMVLVLVSDNVDSNC